MSLHHMTTPCSASDVLCAMLALHAPSQNLRGGAQEPSFRSQALGTVSYNMSSLCMQALTGAQMEQHV